MAGLTLRAEVDDAHGDVATRPRHVHEGAAERSVVVLVGIHGADHEIIRRGVEGTGAGPCGVIVGGDALVGGIGALRDAASNHRQPEAVRVGRLGEGGGRNCQPDRQGEQGRAGKRAPPAWAVWQTWLHVTSVDERPHGVNRRLLYVIRVYSGSNDPERQV